MSVFSNQNFYFGSGGGTEINPLCKYSVLANGDGSTSHTFSLEGQVNEVTSIADYALEYAFYNCTGLTGAVSFPNLTNIGDYGLFYTFYGCTGITSISFPSLTTVGEYGAQYAISKCTGITSISFPSLTTVGAYSFYGIFSGCTGITGAVYFPMLTNIGSYAFYNAFYNCTGITEVHFRSEVNSVYIGGSNFSGTVYYDL